MAHELNQAQVYGYTFKLNVAACLDGRKDWTGKAPLYKHFCLIELGEDKQAALVKVEIIIASMGHEFYQFTMRATPKVATETWSV